jgi:hypothetical protein
MEVKANIKFMKCMPGRGLNGRMMYDDYEALLREWPSYIARYYNSIYLKDWDSARKISVSVFESIFESTSLPNMRGT